MELEKMFGEMNVSGDSGKGDDYYLIRDAEGDFIWQDKSDPYQKLYTMKTIENGIYHTLQRLDQLIGKRYKNQQVWDDIKYDGIYDVDLNFKISVKKLVEIGGYRVKVNFDVIYAAFRILSNYYLIKYYMIEHFNNDNGHCDLYQQHKTFKFIENYYYENENGPVSISFDYYVSSEINLDFGKGGLRGYAFHATSNQSVEMTYDFYTIYYDLITQGYVYYVPSYHNPDQVYFDYDGEYIEYPITNVYPPGYKKYD